MGYSIDFDEEQNVVEIWYDGINARLLAEMNLRLIEVENEIESDNTNNELAELEEDINSLTTLVQAQSSALTREISDRVEDDQEMTEAFANELIEQQQEYSSMIEHEAELRAQAILDEATARGAAIAHSEAIIMTDVAILATSVEGMATELGAAQSSIIEVQDSLVTETMARTAQYSALQADYNDTHAAILEESVARSTEDEALAYQISIIEASTGANYAAILAEQVARTNADSALATSISAVSARVDTNSAAVIAEASARISADGDINAKYSVKIDVNGSVSGFDLISTANVNNLPMSAFRFRADAFSIFNGISPVAPFSVTGGVVYMTNVVIDGAYIKDLTVGTLKIADYAVTKPSIAHGASELYLPPSLLVTLATVTHPSAGGFIVVDFWADIFDYNTSTAGTSQLTLFRDGVSVYTHVQSIAAAGPLNFEQPPFLRRYVEPDSSVSHTYVLKIYSARSLTYVYERGIQVTELKK